MILYEKHGHKPPRVDAPTSFATKTTKELYTFAKSILDEWDDCARIKQKNCLVALSGIVNTMDEETRQNCTASSVIVDHCHDKDFFTVTESQKQVYGDIKRVLGSGTLKELRDLRRYCSRHYNNLEEVSDNGGWPPDEVGENDEKLKIMRLMEFICSEMMSTEQITKTSEHEDVFVWRGLARILYDHDLVVRVGELGATATRHDRVAVENEFGGKESNVRSRKIDLMHQLCLQGRQKALEMIAWEAKSDGTAADALQAQLRKNIRINASIMNKLSPYLGTDFPRPSPMVLDIVGSRALVYMVSKIEPRIFGAAAVMNRMIELPTSPVTIADFLDGGHMSALLRIGFHNSKFASLVKDGYKKALNQEVMAKMTGAAGVRNEEPPAIFTPSKKRVRHYRMQV
ncbi:hypothetical protein BGZ65_006648 [Modicella reniformis]|uniref:Uncharacterized protein n=1 Tax=Modicella reniformis TaxID=1440133 RepID=A0A9P6M8H7_9FUNG|nr:hypothetical protein BGZ65_006648 [Modicella reniformis]